MCRRAVRRYWRPLGKSFHSYLVLDGGVKRGCVRLWLCLLLLTPDPLKRHDFYQTPTTVIASFFLKKINKENAVVSFHPTELSLDLVTTDATPKRYKKVVPLYGPIDPEASSSKIMGTKLEVTFVKADGASWPVLRSDEARTGEIIQVGKAGRVL